MALKSLQLLQQFWHDDRYDFNKVTVFFVDRGAPDDLSSEEGKFISKPESGFTFTIWDGVQNKEIPYHRITRIEYDGKCVFERLNIPAADQNRIRGYDNEGN